MTVGTAVKGACALGFAFALGMLALIQLAQSVRP